MTKRSVQNVDLSTWEIEFKDVYFKYPNTKKYILNNFSIKLRKGQKIAITGLNGAGKTTFIKLLMRLYDPDQGTILLNGVDIKEYPRNEIYALFAPLFQEVFMFPFSIKENISLQKKEKIDEKRVEWCFNQVGMADKIQSLEQKINTSCLKILDDNGIQFSGGEQQRLLLARTLYANREVYIFDEPTAALDPLAEDSMYQNFNKMTQGKTAIFITHRLASTRFCDLVYVFENGHIIEQGTHESLLKQKGEYYRLYWLQAKNYQLGETCNV